MNEVEAEVSCLAGTERQRERRTGRLFAEPSLQSPLPPLRATIISIQEHGPAATALISVGPEKDTA